MGPKGAVEILYKGEASEERATEYREKFAHPYQAAARGYLDDIIDPRDTRPRLIHAHLARAPRRAAVAARARRARRKPAARVSPSGHAVYGQRDGYAGSLVPAVFARLAAGSHGRAVQPLVCRQCVAESPAERNEDPGSFVEGAQPVAGGVRHHGIRAAARRARAEMEQAPARLGHGERDEGRSRAGAGLRLRRTETGGR